MTKGRLSSVKRILYSTDIKYIDLVLSYYNSIPILLVWPTFSSDDAVHFVLKRICVGYIVKYYFLMN